MAASDRGEAMPHTLAAALRHLARSIAVVALGVLVLGVATLGQVPAPVGLAAMAAGDPVTFTGHVYGHGRGMGQHGAYGYARSGRSHEQLLARYYGNTVPTQQGNPVMTVRLVGQHNRAVDVFSDRAQSRLTQPPSKSTDETRSRPATARDHHCSCSDNILCGGVVGTSRVAGGLSGPARSLACSSPSSPRYAARRGAIEALVADDPVRASCS